MTKLELGLVGALAGALIVMVAHPVTQPVLRIGLLRMGMSKFLETSSLVPGNSRVLPDPTSLMKSSQWVQEGCRKVNAHDGPSVDELLTLVELCQQSAEVDLSNAFWLQCEAVFQKALDNSPAANQAWRAASDRNSWNDFQGRRLDAVVDGLRSEYGRTMAWHEAAALNMQDNEVPKAIREFSIVFMRSHQTLDDRFCNLKNAVLMRDGATTIRGSLIGVLGVEQAALGKTPTGSTPKISVSKRFEFVDQLSKAKMQAEAIAAREALSTNEAYRAMIEASERDKTVDGVTTGSIILSSLPGALIAVGLIFLMLGLAAWKVANLSTLPGPTAYTIPIVTGVVAGLAVFAFSRLVFPALFITIVGSGFLIRPPVEVDGREEKISHWIMWLGNGLIALVALTCVLATIANCPPAWAARMYGQLDLPGVFDFETLWSVAIVLLGTIIGAVQVWAFARRSNPYRAVCRILGGTLLGVSVCLLAGAVIATPVCLAGDLQLRETTRDLLTSEPRYYLQNL